MALAFDDPRDGLGQAAVVDRVGQLVGPARGSEIGEDVEVDFEGLGPNLLLGQRAVRAEGAQPAQLDAIHQRGVSRPRPGARPRSRPARGRAAPSADC